MSRGNKIFWKMVLFFAGVTVIPAFVARFIIVDPLLPYFGNWAWAWGALFAFSFGPVIVLLGAMWGLFLWKPNIED